VAAKPWKASSAAGVGGLPQQSVQPVKVRSSSLTRPGSAATGGVPVQSQSVGNDLITPDSPRSDVVVNSRRPTGRLPSANDQQVAISFLDFFQELPTEEKINEQAGSRRPNHGLPPCRGGGAYAPMTRTII